MKKIGLVGGTGPEYTVEAEDVSLTAITMHMAFAELVYSINETRRKASEY
ncbi:MAG: hypothetical protein II397_10825 [Treponema sp.]|nr:hypothetical protein [Treponema sp.]